MSTEEKLHQLKMNGYCVLEGIIPDDKIDEIRESVVAAQAAHHEKAEAELAKIRARGHRVGVQGVANLRGVINETQTFAPYLVDEQIMALTDALFGPYVRISCTDCVINYPGNERGYWHSDWPYNQTNATHIPAPYPDTIMHLSTIWMLTPFGSETGGTYIIPGSHRTDDNPSAAGISGIDRDAPYPTETQASGPAGSVLLYDSRLWHAVPPNRSDTPRVAIIVRYAPWWLNLNPTQAGNPEHTRMVIETDGKNYDSPLIRSDVYESLPDNVKPLYRHWVET
ncbi:phytanoyl-CoA dioxygenase [Candidatus Poribacteria bacterium]|nr:MAG: phytanoyl-CoA dioxygenase [Candidatus Poribacteria bacterium]